MSNSALIPAAQVRSYRQLLSLGSDGELDTQLELARRLSLLTSEVVGDLVERSDNVGRLLQGLWSSLE